MLCRMRKREFNLAPYKDVIIFMITLLISNYAWKYSMWGEEDGVGAVTWLGIVDCTPVFDAYAEHITDAVYMICSSVRDTLTRPSANLLCWSSGSGTRIVWSCTPLKQAFIWLCLMLTTAWGNEPRGREMAKRIGWILLGLVVIHTFNILRISIITLFIEHHPEWFELLHTYIFKYLFYGIMFLLWVVYVEKLRRTVDC